MCPRIPVIDARLGNRNNKFLLKFMCFSPIYFINIYVSSENTLRGSSMEKDKPTISVVDPVCLSRIRGSKVKKIPGSGSASKSLNYFNLTQQIVTMLSEL